MAGLYVETKLRPCFVTTYKNDPEKKWNVIKGGELKALFHCWSQKSNVIGPSAMVGGHNGGVVAGMVAIVELEDGRIREASPGDIRFVKGAFDDYSFEEEKN